MSVVVYSSDSSMEDKLREVLDDGVQVGRVDRVEGIEGFGSTDGQPPEVLLVGEDVAMDDALALAERIDRQRPEISVIIVAEPSAETLTAALRVGVRDVLHPQADPEDTRRAVQHAVETARARRQALPDDTAASSRSLGRIITVASPKGGCGKTTVATNLAIEFGHRVPGETVIVDLDLQFGDVGSSLGVEHEHDVVEAIDALGSDDMVLKSYLTSHPSGCYALCGPTSPAAAENVTGQQVADLLHRLAVGFRYVIVDTAPGLAEYTLSALEVSDYPILLAGMDVPSIRGLQRAMTVLDELDLLAPARKVVLNFVDRRSGLTVEDVEGMLGTSIDVQLPRSREVPLSTNRGVPLLDESTRDPVARGLRELTDALDARHPASRARRTRRWSRTADPTLTEDAT